MKSILKEAKEVLSIEYKAIKSLMSTIDENFVSGIELLYQCKGRVIIAGMGKSGFIGKKIAATLSSTWTPSFFLHAAEDTLAVEALRTMENYSITSLIVITKNNEYATIHIHDILKSGIA